MKQLKLSEIEIPLAKKMVQVTPSQNIKVTVSKANKDKIIQNIRVVPNISAPLPAGSVVATLEVVLSDTEKVNFVFLARGFQMFFRILTTALFAGFIAGVISAVMQIIFLQPILVVCFCFS